MILAWNAHSVPRRGIPNVLQTEAFHTAPIHPLEVPQCSSVVSEYRQRGGRLTDPNSPGTDPLRGNDTQYREREQLWERECGIDLGSIYSQTISGNTVVLENVITSYRDITFRLAG